MADPPSYACPYANYFKSSTLNLLKLEFGGPFLPDFLAFLGAELVGDGEVIAPGKRLAGVDEHAAHGEIAFLASLRRQTRVEIAGPRFENLHGFRRIDARAHGPNDLFQIHRVDVVINCDVVAVHARPGLQTGDGRQRMQR